MSISVKYDGSALQYSKGRFYKRPYKPAAVLPDKVVTAYDLALNDYYNKPIDHLRNEEIDSVAKNYDVVNFEIFSDTQEHTISYKSTPFKNNIIILSAYRNGKEVNINELMHLANELNVSCANYIIENEPLSSIGITYNMLIDNKDDLDSLFEIFYKRLSNVSKEPIDKETLEGFVLTIDDEDSNTVRKYKVNNPDFMRKFFENRNNEELEEYSFKNLAYAFLETLKMLSGLKIPNFSEDFEKRWFLLNEIAESEDAALLEKYYKKDLAANNISSFSKCTLNLEWIKKNYPEYRMLNQLCSELNIWKEIAFIFLLMFKRVHKNETFNVGEELTTQINNFIEQNFLSNNEVNELELIKEGLDINYFTKTISYNPEHQNNLDTSEINNPTFDESILNDGVKVWSIFKRKKGNFGDGNPLIYALKNENDWKFESEKDRLDLIHQFDLIIDKYIAEHPFDITIVIPSSKPINEYIAKRISEKTRGTEILANLLRKLTTTEIHDYVLEFNSSFRKAYPTRYEFEDKLNELSSYLNKMNEENEGYFTRHKIKNNELRNVIDKTLTNAKQDDLNVAEKINGKNVLIIDDTISRGQTIQEAYDIIKNTYSPKSISILTLLSNLK